MRSMHHARFTGTPPREVTGQPVPLFTYRMFCVEKAPSFKPKDVDPVVMTKGEWRYAVVHMTGSSLYLLG